MPRVTIFTAMIVIEDDGESPVPAKPPKPEPQSMQEALDRLTHHLLSEMQHGRDCSPFFFTQN